MKIFSFPPSIPITYFVFVFDVEFVFPPAVPCLTLCFTPLSSYSFMPYLKILFYYRWCVLPEPTLLPTMTMTTLCLMESHKP